MQSLTAKVTFRRHRRLPLDANLKDTFTSQEHVWRCVKLYLVWTVCTSQNTKPHDLLQLLGVESEGWLQSFRAKQGYHWRRSPGVIKKGMRMFHFGDISSFRCEMKCKPPVLHCLRCRIQGIRIHFEIWTWGRWRGMSQVYPQTWWHHGSEHYTVTLVMQSRRVPDRFQTHWGVSQQGMASLTLSHVLIVVLCFLSNSYKCQVSELMVPKVARETQSRIWPVWHMGVRLGRMCGPCKHYMCMQNTAYNIMQPVLETWSMLSQGLSETLQLQIRMHFWLRWRRPPAAASRQTT